MQGGLRTKYCSNWNMYFSHSFDVPHLYANKACPEQIRSPGMVQSLELEPVNDNRIYAEEEDIRDLSSTNPNE